MFFVGFFFGVLLISVVLITWQAIYPDGSLPEVQSAFGQVFATRKTKKKPKYVSEEDQWKKEQSAPPADPGI